MSTLTEIEAAVEKLPPVQQKQLLTSLSARLAQRHLAVHDPVEDIIGAFAGEARPTGRHAEEILYGENGGKDRVA